MFNFFFRTSLDHALSAKTTQPTNLDNWNRMWSSRISDTSNTVVYRYVIHSTFNQLQSTAALYSTVENNCFNCIFINVIKERAKWILCRNDLPTWNWFKVLPVTQAQCCASVIAAVTIRTCTRAKHKIELIEIDSMPKIPSKSLFPVNFEFNRRFKNEN